MKQRIMIVLLAFATASLEAQPEPGIDKFVPMLDQLGAGWVSSTIVALVDPLSSPREAGSEGPYLERAREMIKTHKREAFAAVRYVYGGSNVWVWAWINRYRSKEEIPTDWGRDKLTKMKLDSLPRAGEEVRFDQRDGLHNDFTFRRGNFLVCVEGVTAPIDKLKQLSVALDGNLLKAQNTLAAKSPAPASPRSEPAGTQFVAEGSVDYYNFGSAGDPKLQWNGFTPVVSNTMNFSVVVSNSCYLMRIVPTKESAGRYQEAGYDGETLYFLIALNRSGPQNAPGVGGGNVANAFIYDHQRVVYSIFAHHMGPVWLMFASGDYFRSVTNGLVDPPLTFGLFENNDYYPRPFRIPAQWTLQQAFPFLPLRVTYQDDGEVKTGPPFQDVKRTPPFDAGFTNIVFRVTGTRKFDDILVPCSAELDTYRPEHRGKPELLHYTSYRLTLKKWSKGTPPTCFKPKLPGLTVFSDTRASAVGRRNAVRADQWPSEEQTAKDERK